ncbi:MAG TPA: ABC transporter substrate-binding protein [Firmicutes bacterium]|nr:ABC transporter substrate-binding protein [Bacillota bacterium]
MKKPNVVRSLRTLLIVFSLGFASQAQAKLNYALAGEPTTLDPTKAADRFTRCAVYQIYDYLIEQLPDRTLVPGLAESWEYSEDGTEIIFHIRENVHFHNGDVLTAEDVAFSLNKAIESPFASRVTTAMDRAEVIDDRTVLLKLHHAFGPIEECLATAQMGIFSKKAYEEDPVKFERHPIATGPYKFVDWVRGSEIKLEAFEDYFRGPAAIKELVLKVMTDPTTCVIALERGEVDFIVQFPAEEIFNIEANPNLKYYPAESTGVVYLPLNNEHEIFCNKKVRQAIAHAVDKEIMILGVQDGRGTPLETPMAKAAFGWPAEFRNREYDPDKARRLLAEAGYPDGFETTIIATEVDDYKRRAEVLQDQLKRVGIDADIESLEWGAFLDVVLTQRDYGIATMSMTTPYLDADHIFELYHSTMVEAGRNFVLVRNEKLDNLLERGRLSIDQEERKQFYKEIAELWKEECFTVPLYTREEGVAAHKDLKGIVEGINLGEYNAYYFYWDK